MVQYVSTHPNAGSSYPMDASSPLAVLCRWGRRAFLCQKWPFFRSIRENAKTEIFAFFLFFSESTDDCGSEFVLQFIFQTEDPTKDRRLTGCNDLHKFFGLIFEPS